MNGEEASLQRFVVAQSREYFWILQELQEGKKEGHWMWFIFPQIKGLGRSPVSLNLSIVNEKEAREYLAHPVLGGNLQECTQTLLSHADKRIYKIFNELDTLKFQASMTLFAHVSPAGSLFHNALDAFFDGWEHRQTLEIIEELSDF